MSTDRDRCQAVARERYLDAVREIYTKIPEETLSGREDELLAAVIWLCIFEVSIENDQESVALC